MEVFLLCFIVIAAASANYDYQNPHQDIFNEANIDIPLNLDRPESIPQSYEYGNSKLNCDLTVSRCRPLIIYVVMVEDDIVDILTPSNKDNQDINIDKHFEPESNPLRESKPKNVKIVCLETNNIDIDSITDSLRSYKLSQKRKHHHKHSIEDFIKYLHTLGVEAPKSLGRKGQGAPPYTIKQVFKKIKLLSPTVHNNYQIIHQSPKKDEYEIVPLKTKEDDDDSLKIIPLSPSTESLNNNGQYETTEINSLITTIYEDVGNGKNYKKIEEKIYSEVVEVPPKEHQILSLKNDDVITEKNYITIEKKIYSNVGESPSKENDTIIIETIYETEKQPHGKTKIYSLNSTTYEENDDGNRVLGNAEDSVIDRLAKINKISESETQPESEIQKLEDYVHNKISELDSLGDDNENKRDFSNTKETIILKDSFQLSPEGQTTTDTNKDENVSSYIKNGKDSNEIQSLPQDKADILEVVPVSEPSDQMNDEILRNTKLNSSSSNQKKEPCNQNDNSTETSNEDLLRQKEITLQRDEKDSKNIEKFLKKNLKHIRIPIDLKTLGISNVENQKIYLCVINY